MRMARCVASVPDMVKRTISADGISLVTSSAQRDLELVAGAQVRAARGLLLHGLDHGGMAVAEEERAVAHPVVDELVPVHVPLARAERRDPRRWGTA